MDKSELIQLIEGPVFKVYSHHLNKNSHNNDIRVENNSKSTETISTVTSNSSSNSKEYSVPLSEAQRDRRTVFVQQLSVRCTDRDLSEFFTSNSCSVRHARIVLDKYTRKSKGVAYVEFFEEETVRAALKLSGKKILGVPVIVELTETEKNRIAQEAASLNAAMSKPSGSGTSATLTSTTGSSTPSDDLVKLYIGSLHPSLTELELEQLFEPFGELESVELLKDERSGESKGVAFVQYKKVGGARMALEALNGFELAGRAIRVGPVRIDKSKQQQQSTQGKPKPLPSQQQQQQAREVDEEENITLNAQKRAELMQKLSNRK